MANNNQPANNALNNGAKKLREIALKLATDAINKARAANGGNNAAPANNAKPNNAKPNNKPANNKPANNKPANA